MTDLVADRAEGPVLTAKQPIALMSLGPRTAADQVRRAVLAEERGFDRIWIDQQPTAGDAGVLAAAVLNATTTAQVGIGVLPIYFRHPAATAQLAAMADEVSGGRRFVLGLGLANTFVNEYLLGCNQGRPLRAMREYVTIVRSLLHDGEVSLTGDCFTARLGDVEYRRPEVPIHIAGLRPAMIRLAVRLGDGLLLWMCSPAYIRDEVLPVVRQACEDFGKDPATFPVQVIVLTSAAPDTPQLRDDIRGVLVPHLMIPHYRRLIADQGHPGVMSGGGIDDAIIDQLTVFGDQERVVAGLDAYRDVGCQPIPAVSEGPSYLETLSALS